MAPPKKRAVNPMFPIQTGSDYFSSLGQLNETPQVGYGLNQQLMQAPANTAGQYAFPAATNPAAQQPQGIWGKLSSMYNNPAAATPQAPAGGGFMGMGATGWGNVIQGAGMLGSAWLGSQQLSQGKKEFKFNKGIAEANLANSAALINTNISRRAESNAASLGLQGTEASAYVDERKKKESVRGTI